LDVLLQDYLISFETKNISGSPVVENQFTFPNCFCVMVNAAIADIQNKRHLLPKLFTLPAVHSKRFFKKNGRVCDTEFSLAAACLKLTC
jgi:hypothetical protein